jgi:hypothetical protein
MASDPKCCEGHRGKWVTLHDDDRARWCSGCGSLTRYRRTLDGLVKTKWVPTRGADRWRGDHRNGADDGE